MRSLLQARPLLAARCEIEHTPERVDADARPSHVTRQGAAALDLAIEAVRSAIRASAMVSAGNTGALMALAKFMLKTLRPGSTGRRSLP